MTLLNSNSVKLTNPARWDPFSSTDLSPNQGQVYPMNMWIQLLIDYPGPYPTARPFALAQVLVPPRTSPTPPPPAPRQSFPTSLRAESAKTGKRQTVTNKIVKFSKTLFIIYFSGKCLSLWMKLIIYSHIGERFIRYTNRPFSNLAYSVCEGKKDLSIFTLLTSKYMKKVLLLVKALYFFNMKCLLYTVLFMPLT